MQNNLSKFSVEDFQNAIEKPDWELISLYFIAFPDIVQNAFEKDNIAIMGLNRALRDVERQLDANRELIKGTTRRNLLLHGIGALTGVVVGKLGANALKEGLAEEKKHEVYPQETDAFITFLGTVFLTQLSHIAIEQYSNLTL